MRNGDLYMKIEKKAFNKTKYINHKINGLYEKFGKRTLDLFFGFCIILFFWWIYVLLAILVCIKLGRPVLFTQDRPGKDEKIFKLYKFRTMTDRRDENGVLLPDEVRLTRFGKLLRATSLDELPEIFNIIKGDMSIIGPRPLLPKYLPFYTEEERERHAVRPGLTGLAQIHGRNYLMWDERLKLDIEYVKDITFMNDLRIFIDTIFKVLNRSGVAEKRIIPLDEYRNVENKK